jgi:twitching motility protein PilT
LNAPAEHQPIDEHDQHSARHEGASFRLEGYFRAMCKAAASDLHFKAGSVPHIRIKAVIRPTKSPPLSGDEIEQMAFELFTEKQKAFYLQHGSIDLAHELDDEGDRFRINVFRQRGETSIAVRRVTRDIPDFEALRLPPILERLSQLHQGLILLSGPTGCGKSTTIAAMLEYINQRRACHILTIEDPIEYLYTDKKALVSQREIGIDVETFESALKYLPREDPDIVLIGEMRDHETVQSALQVSETGHLVFGTVHASSAAQTIERVLALFPADTRDLIRQSMSFNLQAVVCQKLLPSIAEGVDRVPAVEVMLASPVVRQFIEEAREQELADVIRSHESEGMQSFTKSLLELIESEYIDPRVGYEVAPNPDELKMRLKGITAGHSGLIGRG